jgi:hypothetical protein
MACRFSFVRGRRKGCGRVGGSPFAEICSEKAVKSIAIVAILECIQSFNFNQSLYASMLSLNRFS